MTDTPDIQTSLQRRSNKKGVLKLCRKFTGEHPYRSAISTKLLCNFIEIALPHGCSLVNLLHIFKTTFLKNTYGELLMLISKIPILRFYMTSQAFWLKKLLKVQQSFLTRPNIYTCLAVLKYTTTQMQPS